ncbi:MAG: carbohydrate-binding protein [Cellvibrio sp.]|uniref:carbohydrate-binding protein n=1 Tax=Cellvibrio sp. TaxID=1965322 RepID=UPI002728BFB3|nr:carbohydrate-binding protein [Cellvibrio sp.]
MNKSALALCLSGALFSQYSLGQVNTPATIQAEAYSHMNGVQLEATSDTGGGQNVGWIDANDWLSYSNNPVNIATAGAYDIEYRIASQSGGGTITFEEAGGTPGYGSIAVPGTGGWQTWRTIKQRITLSAGVHRFGIKANTGGFNINWFRIVPVQTQSWTPLPAIKQSGSLWVNANTNQRVDLRGTNIGNWLIQEFWMMGGLMSTDNGGINDQCTLESVMSQRFGNAEKERLMKVFRDSYITTRDFDMMKAMGMNVVRIPFLYSLIEDEYNPYNVRSDAWQYLDWAINEAEKRGMYTILDLHGAVGGQAATPEQHDGCIGAAELWTNANYWDRTKWLWDMIAQRYNGRSAVAAYDLLNEPWGTDATTLANRSYELFNVVRAKDANHIILLPGHNSGIDAYGNPNNGGRTNVSTWMHFYPGLWGWNSASEEPTYQANMHANWLHCNSTATNPAGTGESCDWRNRINGIQTPFLVGEFQPWTLLGSYGGQMTRKTYDIYNSYGWAATNWAWKTTSQNGSNGDTNSWNWGMITNSSNGGGMSGINVSNASAAQIESWFRQFSTQPLVRNESIATWMNWKPTVGTRIEAEMFKDHSGIRMETTTDAGGGFNAGSTDDNDWMSYPINIPTAGNYTLQVRVASPYNGGTLVLSRNGNDLGVVTVPNTGGWQNWQTVNITVNLQAGQQDLAIFVRKGGWNINWWQLTKQ